MPCMDRSDGHRRLCAASYRHTYTICMLYGWLRFAISFFVLNKSFLLRSGSRGSWVQVLKHNKINWRALDNWKELAVVKRNKMAP